MKQVAMIFLMFLLAQLLGLYVGAMLITLSSVMPEISQLNVAPGGESGDVSNSLFFLLYILAGAAVILIVLKLYKGLILFKLMETMIILVASFIVFFAVFIALGVPNYEELSLVFALGLAVMKFIFPRIRNATAVIASAGVGAIFGFSLDIIPAILFVFGLCLYDFLSVFWTRHMITMARELGKRELSFSVSASGKSYKAYRAPPSRLKTMPKEEKITTLELGTGDMAVPLMLAVSAYKVGGLVSSFSVVIGSSLALAYVLYYVYKNRVFLPALPPLAFGGLLVLAVVKLVGLF
ncbi:MAG: presenilin family intramembrane aspartyl protease [Candidatus Micrarchaeota archaeon]